MKTWPGLSVFHWKFTITYIFSISLKFATWYITSQREEGGGGGQVLSKECYFANLKIVFSSFSFIFFMKHQTKIGDKKLPVELNVTEY